MLKLLNQGCINTTMIELFCIGGSMPSLNKVKLKEKFLENIQMVDKEMVLEELKNNTEGLDIYTYFITKNACNTGSIDMLELQEFLLKIYSDWYFLHKNNNSAGLSAFKLLSEYSFSPIALTQKDCYELIKSGKYSDILPVNFQYVNKLEEKYFVAIKTDMLYGRKYTDQELMARLYINLPATKILDFVKEFLDRVYMEELPATIKFLNSDDRCDTIIIYCDYEFVQKVVDTIVDIKYDYPNKFVGVGGVSELLGKVNEFIGFGEQPTIDQTYFKSRCLALESIYKLASNQVLKEHIVAPEQKIIFVKNGKNYTPTEYLIYLIEKNAIRLIEDKISKLENLEEKDAGRLSELYHLRENLSSEIDFELQSKMLKKSITRNTKYALEIAEDIVGDDYDYINKLYNVFASEEDKSEFKTDDQKKKLIADIIFNTTNQFCGADTREALAEYFREELSQALEELYNKSLDEIKYSRQSSILSNLKMKECMKLKKIIKGVLSDTDEGKEYIDKCINDYVRLLSSNALDNVEIYVLDKKISLGASLNEDIVHSFPSLQEDINKLTLNNRFVDRIMARFDINSDNMCINKLTKNISKKRTRKIKESRSYYYNPNPSHEFIY